MISVQYLFYIAFFKCNQMECHEAINFFGPLLDHILKGRNSLKPEKGNLFFYSLPLCMSVCLQATIGLDQGANFLYLLNPCNIKKQYFKKQFWRHFSIFFSKNEDISNIRNYNICTHFFLNVIRTSQKEKKGF